MTVMVTALAVSASSCASSNERQAPVIRPTPITATPPKPVAPLPLTISSGTIKIQEIGEAQPVSFPATEIMRGDRKWFYQAGNGVLLRGVSGTDQAGKSVRLESVLLAGTNEAWVRDKSKALCRMINEVYSSRGVNSMDKAIALSPLAYEGNAIRRPLINEVGEPIQVEVRLGALSAAIGSNTFLQTRDEKTQAVQTKKEANVDAVSFYIPNDSLGTPPVRDEVLLQKLSSEVFRALGFGTTIESKP